MNLREIIEEKKFKGMISQNHTDWLIEKVLAMRALLVEWQNTEFFEDSVEWARWIESFGPRVRKELEEL